jgi:D-serine deaminase-like pyridoxal phosphate-dependent protein
VKRKESGLDALATPALVVNVEALDRNLSRLADHFASRNARLRGLNPDITYTVSSVPDGAVTTHTGAELTEGSLVIKMAREEAGIWKITESNKPNAGDA